MGGVLPELRWLPAAVRRTEPLAPLTARPLDAASGRGPPGRLRRCHVPTRAACAAPGLHLGDAEPWPERRRQQNPAAPLVLAGEGRFGRPRGFCPARRSRAGGAGSSGTVRGPGSVAWAGEGAGRGRRTPSGSPYGLAVSAPNGNLRFPGYVRPRCGSRERELSPSNALCVPLVSARGTSTHRI